MIFAKVVVSLFNVGGQHARIVLTATYCWRTARKGCCRTARILVLTSEDSIPVWSLMFFTMRQHLLDFSLLSDSCDIVLDERICTYPVSTARRLVETSFPVSLLVHSKLSCRSSRR